MKKTVWIVLLIGITGCEFTPEYLEYPNGVCTISCPEAVICDENFDYRAYLCRQENILIYIYFNPEIAIQYSLQLFEQNFNYYDLLIYFPDRQTKKKEVYYTNRDPIRDSPIVDYSNGQITMQISGTIDEITTKIERRKNCQTGDIVGICYEQEEANIPYNHTLTFTIEE